MQSTAWWLVRLATALLVAGSAAGGVSGAPAAWVVPEPAPGADVQADDEDDDDDGRATEEADEERDDDRDGEEDVYESPQYGYSLTYDPEEWEVVLEDDDPDDAWDEVSLGNGTSVVRLIGDPDYDEDELADCVEDYVGALESGENNADVEPLDEPDAEGEEDDRAWATYSYTFTNEDGEESDNVRYVECRALGEPPTVGAGGPPEGGPPEGEGGPPEGEAPEGGPPEGEAPVGASVTLVILHDAPAEDYEDEIEARETLLEGLEVPESPGADEG